MGGGLLAPPSCSQMGMEVHGFRPLAKAGRQRSERQTIPRAVYGCSVPASSGPRAWMALQRRAASRPPCLRRTNIVCRRFCAPPLNAWHPKGCLTGLLLSKRLHNTPFLPASLSARFLQPNLSTFRSVIQPREHSASTLSHRWRVIGGKDLI